MNIHYNWRNTVIGTRSFGNSPDVVIDRAKAYFDGLSESGSAAAMKHFPGDGVDERDQHVVTTYNTLGYDEWTASYGRVYRELIDHGVQSIMIGHIGAPTLSRHFRPTLTDSDILPATLASELLQDLPRTELGFNGLILTDASLMVGMTQALKRRDLVPAAIAAGCDMFLFFRNADEDFRYMLDGYRSGVITENRRHDALLRILGLKASLGLHTTASADLVPGPEALTVIGSAEHRAIAASAADRNVTLVKDTQATLPLSPDTHRRIRLYEISGQADFTGTDPSGFLDIAREELEKAGFEVHVFRDALQRQADGEDRVYFHTVMADEANEQYAEKYDAAIIFANVTGFAQEASVRIRWSTPMAAEIPWYVTEVPTVFVSLAQPNHLIDVPMVTTVIHAYAPSREAIAATVAKITGTSPFTERSTTTSGATHSARGSDWTGQGAADLSSTRVDALCLLALTGAAPHPDSPAGDFRSQLFHHNCMTSRGDLHGQRTGKHRRDRDGGDGIEPRSQPREPRGQHRRDLQPLPREDARCRERIPRGRVRRIGDHRGVRRIALSAADRDHHGQGRSRH